MLTLCDNPRTEILRGLPFPDYCAIPALNQSLLKTYSTDFDGCPALYRFRSSTPDSRDSDALRAGRAFHARLLEPKAFGANYRVMKPEDCEQIFQSIKALGAEKKSTASYMKHPNYASWAEAGEVRGFFSSAAYKEWKKADAREIISTEDDEILHRMTLAIWENPDVAEELEGATLDDCEVTVLAPFKFKDGRMIQLKARLDVVCASDAIIDAKTCQSTNAHKFAAATAKYGYDIQSGFYLYAAAKAGIEKKRFGFLAQEKTAPYLNCIHWMPEDWVRHATLRFKRIISDVAESIRMNHWPNPPTGMLEAPGWLQQEIELIS